MSAHEDDYEDFPPVDETEPESFVPAKVQTKALSPAKLYNLKKLAEETASQLGTLVKFNKGHWYIGDDEVTGQRRIAHVDRLMRGWIKFVDGKVVDRRVGSVVEGFESPPRASLGDTNEADWEKDPTGKPRDPWVEQYFLPLRDAKTNALATYCTNSVGGRAAVGVLAEMLSENPHNGSPIVRLATGSYRHKVYGRVETPELQVIGWTGIADDLNGDDIPF